MNNEQKIIPGIMRVESQNDRSNHVYVEPPPIGKVKDLSKLEAAEAFAQFQAELDAISAKYNQGESNA